MGNLGKRINLRTMPGHNDNSSLLSSSTSLASLSRPASLRSIRQNRCFFALTLILAVAVVVLVKYQHTIQNGKLLRKKSGVVSKSDDYGAVTYPLHPNVVSLDHRNHYYLFPTISSKYNNETSSAAQSESPTRIDGGGRVEDNVQTHARKNVKGVLLYFHSCQQTGLELFHLPEHRIIASVALKRGLLVFAPTSRDRRSGCFTSEDVETLPRLIDDWLKSQYLQYLPRIAIADSSGGSFLSFVWKEMDIKSVGLYNTPVTYEFDMSLPTAIVTMQSDEVVTNKAFAYTSMLLNMNISTKLFKVNPRPFTPALCSARFPELAASSPSSTPSSSSSSSFKTGFCDQVFRTIQKDYSHLLDNFGYVKDGTHSVRRNEQWSSLLDNIDRSFQNSNVGTKDGVQSFSSPYDTSKAGNGRTWFSTVLEHEIRTCQGFHAMTADFIVEVLHFLTSNIDTQLGNKRFHNSSNGNSTSLAASLNHADEIP